jgi:tetratricopeptide (TPR) repeat protein
MSSPIHGSLERADALERLGRLSEAVACYAGAIEAARTAGDPRLLSEGLRRLSVLHHQRGEPDARQLAVSSLEIATQVADARLKAQALNVLGAMNLDQGDLGQAYAQLFQAWTLSEDYPEVRGRTEQNLGVVANIRGNWPGAIAHYLRSAKAFEAAADGRGCAIAYHNLGMISADRQLWSQADRYYRQALTLATKAGDCYLRALCLLNYAEVHLVRQQFDRMQDSVNTALAYFEEQDLGRERAAAYKLLGMGHRENGQFDLAESMLELSIEFAIEAEAPLAEAEARRELARLNQDYGLKSRALELFTEAQGLFHQVEARLELHEVATAIAELEVAA